MTDTTTPQRHLRGVPADLWRAARIAALRAGQTVSDWIAEAIRQRLEREEENK